LSSGQPIQGPRGLRRGSAASLARLRIRILPRAYTSVSCECCVFSGRWHWVGLITHPEVPYRVCCVSVVVKPRRGVHGLLVAVARWKRKIYLCEQGREVRNQKGSAGRKVGETPLYEHGVQLFLMARGYKRSCGLVRKWENNKRYTQSPTSQRNVIVHTWFTNVAAGRKITPVWPRVGYPRYEAYGGGSTAIVRCVQTLWKAISINIDKFDRAKQSSNLSDGQKNNKTCLKIFSTGPITPYHKIRSVVSGLTYTVIQTSTCVHADLRTHAET
jgi:hypothetical protein